MTSTDRRRAGHRRGPRAGRGDRQAIARGRLPGGRVRPAGDELKTSVDALGDGVIAVELDVTSAEQWDSAVRQTVERFGSLTTLVNNAGVLHRASLADETPAGFEGSWRVNCLGPFLGIQAALEHLRRADGAAIVNTCSTGAIRPFPNHAAYGSSKWATARPHPDRRRRTGTRRDPGQRGASRPGRDPDARRGDAGAACREGAAGHSRWRSPTRWRSWCPSMRRSSPVPNSSSTADSLCRSDEPDGQVSLGGNHRRRPGWAGAGDLPEEERLSRLHDLRPRGRRRRHLADQHLSRAWPAM